MDSYEDQVRVCTAHNRVSICRAGPDGCVWSVRPDDVRRVMAFQGSAYIAPPWWERYRGSVPEAYLRLVEREQAATSLSQYQPLLVPGLLQTREYAREVLRLSATAHQEPKLELRMRRQDLLRQADCPKFSVLLDESVLRRGRPEILEPQLDKLRDVASGTAPIAIRVIPSSLLSVDSPFLIVDPYDYVFVETAVGGRDDEDAAAYRWCFGEKWNMAEPLERFL